MFCYSSSDDEQQDFVTSTRKRSLSIIDTKSSSYSNFTQSFAVLNSLPNRIKRQQPLSEPQVVPPVIVCKNIEKKFVEPSKLIQYGPTSDPSVAEGGWTSEEVNEDINLCFSRFYFSFSFSIRQLF